MKFTWLLPYLALVDALAPAGHVCLYIEPNYSGQRTCVKAGMKYDLCAKRNGGCENVWNNKILSIEFGEGVTSMVLFQDKGFENEVGTITESQPSLAHGLTSFQIASLNGPVSGNTQGQETAINRTQDSSSNSNTSQEEGTGTSVFVIALMFPIVLVVGIIGFLKFYQRKKKNEQDENCTRSSTEIYMPKSLAHWLHGDEASASSSSVFYLTIHSPPTSLVNGGSQYEKK